MVDVCFHQYYWLRDWTDGISGAQPRERENERSVFIFSADVGETSVPDDNNDAVCDSVVSVLSCSSDATPVGAGWPLRFSVALWTLLDLLHSPQLHMENIPAGCGTFEN